MERKETRRTFVLGASKEPLDCTRSQSMQEEFFTSKLASNDDPGSTFKVIDRSITQLWQTPQCPRVVSRSDLLESTWFASNGKCIRVRDDEVVIVGEGRTLGWERRVNTPHGVFIQDNYTRTTKNRTA